MKFVEGKSMKIKKWWKYKVQSIQTDFSKHLILGAAPNNIFIKFSKLLYIKDVHSFSC